jgi:hypothetical protein
VAYPPRLGIIEPCLSREGAVICLCTTPDLELLEKFPHSVNGTNLWGPCLPSEGRRSRVPAMSSGNPAYEPITLVALIERIGIDLRERYRPAEELPPMWLSMLARIDTKLDVPDRDIKGAFESLT